MNYPLDPKLLIDRQRRIAAIPRRADTLHTRLSAIHARVLAESPSVREPNFRMLGKDDLELMIGMYDREFFDGEVRRMLGEEGVSEIDLSVSRRMTRSGGLTERWVYPGGPTSSRPFVARYRIAVSAVLLFQSFRPESPSRTITVAGLECKDRLEALQRILEHELLHLIEMLAWGRSECSGENFLELSQGFFGHRSSSHNLVTTTELASRSYDVRVGDRVSFDFEGVNRVGVVNRITRRATVLVESPTGRPYTDGKRYMRFYVPLTMLRKVGAANS